MNANVAASNNGNGDFLKPGMSSIDVITNRSLSPGEPGDNECHQNVLFPSQMCVSCGMNKATVICSQCLGTNSAHMSLPLVGENTELCTKPLDADYYMKRKFFYPRFIVR